MHAPNDTVAAGLDKYSAPKWLGDRAIRRFHVMAKPAGSACNLGCRRKLPRQVDSSKLEFPRRAVARDSALAAGFPARRAA